MNLPNLLSLFRIGASFVFLYFGLRRAWNIAFPLFILAALTDMIDGTVARLLRQRTRLGAFLDPMADKLLMFFSFVALTVDHRLPLLLTVLVIVRDLLIVSGVATFKWRGIPIAYCPTYFSKVTTFFQILSIFLALLLTQPKGRWISPFYGNIVLKGPPFIFGVTALLTVLTGVQYFRMGMGILRHETLEAHR